MSTTTAPYAPGDITRITHDDPALGSEVCAVTAITRAPGPGWIITVDTAAGVQTHTVNQFCHGRGRLKFHRTAAPRVGQQVVAKPTAPGIPAALAGQVLTITRVTPAADEPKGWFLTLTHQQATTYALLCDTWPAPPPCHGQVGPPSVCPRCGKASAVYLQEAWADTTQCIAPGCGYRDSRSIGD